MDSFSFEHTFKFNEKLYVQLNSIFTRKNRPLRIVLPAFVGIICLFWKYSLLIGIATLITVGIASIMPSLFPHTTANNYKKLKYLHKELTYGVSEKKLWIKGEQLSVEFGWKHAVVWDEREGWLRVSANNTPALWFSIEKLKEALIYERVVDLCKKYAVRYNSYQIKQ